MTFFLCNNHTNMSMSKDQFQRAMNNMQRMNESVISKWDRNLTRINITNPYAVQNPFKASMILTDRNVLKTRDVGPPRDHDPVPKVVLL